MSQNGIRGSWCRGQGSACTVQERQTRQEQAVGKKGEDASALGTLHQRLTHSTGLMLREQLSATYLCVPGPPQASTMYRTDTRRLPPCKLPHFEVTCCWGEVIGNRLRG